MSPMTYSGASCSSTVSRPLWSSRGARMRASASTSRQCCATEKMWAPLVWPFQRATRASPCAMSSSSMSSGEGSSRSSRRPDSMRCQARGAVMTRKAGRLARRARSATTARSKLLHGGVTVASDQMVVNHADRLHEGIDDGRPAELEAALLKVLRDGARNRGLVGHLSRGLVVIDLRLTVDEIPQQLGKARTLLHYVQEGARRQHRALDLRTVAHDAGILHQALDLRRPVARDLLGRKAVEGAA